MWWVLCTLNCMLLPAVHDSGSRAESAADWLQQLHGKVHVLVLTEIFSPIAHDVLHARLRRYWPYMTRPLHNAQGLNGGIMLLSKWPITHVYALPFTAAVSSDRMVAKGAVAAVVRPPDGEAPLVVLGTHMQAGNSGAAVRVRQQQWMQLYGFMRAFLNVATYGLPRVVLGDFNEELRLSRTPAELHLGFVPPRASDGVTFDMQTNTIARERAEEGDVSAMLDGVLVDQSTPHRHVATTRVIRPRTASGHPFTDHEAVLCVLHSTKTDKKLTRS